MYHVRWTLTCFVFFGSFDWLSTLITVARVYVTLLFGVTRRRICEIGERTVLLRNPLASCLSHVNITQSLLKRAWVKTRRVKVRVDSARGEDVDWFDFLSLFFLTLYKVSYLYIHSTNNESLALFLYLEIHVIITQNIWRYCVDLGGAGIYLPCKLRCVIIFTC